CLYPLSKYQQTPNVVFILAGKQDTCMSSIKYMQEAQNLLIAEGILYTRNYTSTAFCCPTRVSILTGLHAHNHQVVDVN
ncbi:uncharacterized protein BDR25DRAFT_170428, partial [Lindgomyces ingoldianus]